VKDLLITIDDVRRAGHCVAGIRRWFETHQLDFRDFLRNGIPAEKMLATGDGQGQQVVERTIERRSRV
jgi:hypothetical protein